MTAGPFRKYLDTYALQPLETKVVTVDLSLVRSNATCKMMLVQDWTNGTDAATTGVELTILPGTGPDPDADSTNNEYATDDASTVDKPSVANPPTGLAPGTNKYNTPFAFEIGQKHPFQRVQITSTDPTKAVNIQLWGNQ